MHFGGDQVCDALVKSRKTPFSVIPAKAGIQYFRALADIWIPAFAGMTTFYEIVKSVSAIYRVSDRGIILDR